MAYTLISQVEAHPGSGGGTSGSIDTSGASIIILAVAKYTSGAASVSDSKGNTYSAQTEYTLNNERLRFYRCDSPVVGSSHTFTVTGTGIYPGFRAFAFSGSAASPADQLTGATGSGSSLSPGSITPSEDNCLLITASTVGNESPSEAVNSPFSSNSYVYTGGFGVGEPLGVAYEIQTTATARNPTWSGASPYDGTRGRVATMMSLKAAAGGGGGGQPTVKRWGGVKFSGAGIQGVW